MHAALQTAIEQAGGASALALLLGITPQAVGQWEMCPPLRVLAVERYSGVRRHVLRSDIYPPPDEVSSSTSQTK